MTSDQSANRQRTLFIKLKNIVLLPTPGTRHTRCKLTKKIC